MIKKIFAFILMITLLMSTVSIPSVFAVSHNIAQSGVTKIGIWDYSESLDVSQGTPIAYASNAGGKLIAMNAGDYASYEVSIETEGVYTLTMAIATPSGNMTQQKFDISVDGEVAEKASLTAGQGMSVPVENQAADLFLTKGKATLTIKATSASLYVFYLKLEKVLSGGIRTNASAYSDSLDVSLGTQIAKASNAGGSLIAMNAGDYASYEFDIEKEGFYGVTMAIATPVDSTMQQKFDISVGGEVMQKTVLVGNKGMTVPVENFAGIIPLAKGKNTITFTATSASLYVFYFKIERFTSNDLGDLTLKDNQGLKGKEGFLTFTENCIANFEPKNITDGFYKMEITSRAKENATLNVSASEETLGMMNIEGDGFYKAPFYCYLSEGDLIKIVSLKGEVDFNKITLTKIDSSDLDVLKTFAEDVNSAKNETDIKEAILNARDVLHPDGKYPETMFLFPDNIYSSLLNKGFRSYQEVAEAYFMSICKEKTNPSFELCSGEEKINGLKSGNLSLKIDKSRLSVKNAFGGIYENGRLKYIASFEDLGEKYLNISFGNVSLDEKNENKIKIIFLDDLEALAPTDTKIYKEIFVDSFGSDITGDGSKNAPFKTIKRAKEEVSYISSEMTGDIIVNIEPGTYFLSETEVFDSTSGGKNGFNVIYKGNESSKPQITGGKQVTGWQHYKDGIYCAPFDGAEDVRNLYVNGYNATRAKGKKLYEMREFYNSPETDAAIDGFVIYPYEFPEKIYKPQGMELIFNLMWANQRLKVNDIIRNDDEIIFVTDSIYYSEEQSGSLRLEAGKKFYLENDLYLLDEEGEFYFSKDDKMLYYYPKAGENISDSEIFVPVTEGLIDVKGDSESPVENIQFKNLDIKYGAWNKPSENGIMFRQADEIKSGMGLEKLTPGQFKVNYAENVLIEDCVFSCFGSAAISLNDGVHNAKINGNLIRDISGSGIIIGSGEHNTNSTDKKRCKNISVTNNVITRVALEFMGCVGISAYYEKGVEILNNTIKEVPYTAIHVGWGWLAGQSVDFGYYNISNNRIEDVMCVMDDGAHIYTLGALSDSVISNNYLKTSGANYGGIYNDTGSCDLNIFKNVIEDVTHSWSIWNAEADVNTYDNYATVDLCQTAGGKQITGIGDITIFDSSNRPEEVLEIIENAGVSEEYEHLVAEAEMPLGMESVLTKVPNEKLSWGEYYIPVSSKKQAVIDAWNYADYYHRDGTDGVIPNSGTKYLSYNQGEWVKYRINVLEEGTYSLSMLYSFFSETVSTALTISIDNKEVLKNVNVNKLSSWSEWAEQTIGNVSLTKGNHEITVKVSKGGLHMRYFMLDKIN